MKIKAEVDIEGAVTINISVQKYSGRFFIENPASIPKSQWIWFMIAVSNEEGYKLDFLTSDFGSASIESTGHSILFCCESYSNDVRNYQKQTIEVPITSQLKEMFIFIITHPSINYIWGNRSAPSSPLLTTSSSTLTDDRVDSNLVTLESLIADFKGLEVDRRDLDHSDFKILQTKNAVTFEFLVKDSRFEIVVNEPFFDADPKWRLVSRAILREEPQTFVFYDTEHSLASMTSTGSDLVFECEVLGGAQSPFVVRHQIGLPYTQRLAKYLATLGSESVKSSKNFKSGKSSKSSIRPTSRYQTSQVRRIYPKK